MVKVFQDDPRIACSSLRPGDQFNLVKASHFLANNAMYSLDWIFADRV